MYKNAWRHGAVSGYERYRRMWPVCVKEKGSWRTVKRLDHASSSLLVALSSLKSRFNPWLVCVELVSYNLVQGSDFHRALRFFSVSISNRCCMLTRWSPSRWRVSDRNSKGHTLKLPFAIKEGNAVDQFRNSLDQLTCPILPILCPEL